MQLAAFLCVISAICGRITRKSTQSIHTEETPMSLADPADNRRHPQYPPTKSSALWCCLLHSLAISLKRNLQKKQQKIKLLSIFVQSKKNNTYIMVKILMLIPVFIIVVILQFSANRFKKTKEEKYTVDGKNIKASNIISICSLFTFIICMFAIVLGSDLFYISWESMSIDVCLFI